MKFGDVVRWREEPDAGRFMVIAPTDDTVYMRVVCIKAAPETEWEVDGDPAVVNSMNMEVCG